MLDFNKTVLAIQAHPDDAEIFCSGTLALLKDNGFKIVIATMTPGGMGGVSLNEADTAEIRKQEAALAAASLGADYYCLEQRDGYVFDTAEARIKVTSLIRNVNAGVVFTHLPYDYHPDHRACSSIVEAGTILATLPNVPTEELPSKLTPLLYYSAPFGFTDHMGCLIPDPTFFIDITEKFEIKKIMLSFHESQKEVMKRMFNMTDFFGDMRNSDLKIGKMAGVKYAEAYWQNRGSAFYKDPFIQEILKKQVR
jgi:N-acetylglucosamine malate deacetylase 1